MRHGAGEWTRQARAAANLPSMVDHRRHLHAHPEVGLELPATHDYIAACLRELGLAPEIRPGGGVTVRIAGRGATGQVRVLRADMDALPLQENTGLPYSSRTPGAMHACGHDLHMAMLLGAAELFVSEPPVHDVVLAFQPGEESDRGALRVLEHDNLRLGTEATAFAIHVNAVVASGTVTSRPGTFMAYGDWFRVSFAGRGGHASAPHLSANPIEGMAAWVQRLDELVTELGHREALVATVTESLAGNTVNVIPTTGSMRGTLRTISEDQRSLLHTELSRLTTEVADALGLERKLDIITGYPALVNDPAFLDAVMAKHDTERPTAASATMAEPSMVIEDFAYFLHRWPGAMVYLGAQVGSRQVFNHSEDVMFDEGAMSVGLALHSLVADLKT
jgi:amidohydrolase